MRCGPRRGRRARILLTWAWAIPICLRQTMSSTSWSKWRASQAPMAIASRAASLGCARRRPIIMAAALAWTSTRKPKSSSPWDRRRGWQALPPRSPSRATSCWPQTPAIQSTLSVSSSRARPSGRCRPRRTKIISARLTGPWPSPCRARRSWWSTIRPTRRPRRSTLPFTSGWSLGRRRTRSGYSPTSPIPNFIMTAIPRRRSCRCPAPRTWRSSSHPCPRHIPWPAGAWALPWAMPS